MSITTKVGSADIVFSHNSERFSNLNRLFTLDDFSDAAGMYQYIKINMITIEITRTVDEATITSALGGSSIYFNQYPTQQGVAPSLDLIAANDSTYKIDTLTFSKQLLKLPVPDMSYITLVGLAPVVFSTGRTMMCPLVEYMSGSICLGSDNTVVAGEVTKLYSILMKFH